MKHLGPIDEKVLTGAVLCECYPPLGVCGRIIFFVPIYRNGIDLSML
jgi:hypothetical protein